MLQRAAGNAYSWWWASHIRTKQSKWLEQNLQDMQEKVHNVMALVSEDGDSFAKRAEMYYKKRPEIIIFVEESYRAYRALAERYDHISTELQNANNTIAYVFPEQVQMAMDDEDDIPSPRFLKKLPAAGDLPKGNIPKVPKLPKEIKGMFQSATKKLQPKKSIKVTTSSSSPAAPKPTMSKPEAFKQIDKLQKQVLVLQTEKEFVKSSYENGLAKYWEIDQQIREIQDKACSLQDEFGAETVIDDDEARSVMTSAALQSCQETLAKLEEKQEKSAEEAKKERKRIKEAQEKLKSLLNQNSSGEIDQGKGRKEDESSSDVAAAAAAATEEEEKEEMRALQQQRQEIEVLREKIKKHFEASADSSFTVSEMAEKIDELVNKVIGLEAAVSSQSALIQRMKAETDELNGEIQSCLESGDKEKMENEKVEELERKLEGIQKMNEDVENQSTNLQTNFMEAKCNLDHLHDKLDSVKPDEEVQTPPRQQFKKAPKFESSQQQPFVKGKNIRNAVAEFDNSVKQDKEKSQRELKQQQVADEIRQAREARESRKKVRISDKKKKDKPKKEKDKKSMEETANVKQEVEQVAEQVKNVAANVRTEDQGYVAETTDGDVNRGEEIGHEKKQEEHKPSHSVSIGEILGDTGTEVERKEQDLGSLLGDDLKKEIQTQMRHEDESSEDAKAVSKQKSLKKLEKLGSGTQEKVEAAAANVDAGDEQGVEERKDADLTRGEEIQQVQKPDDNLNQSVSVAGNQDLGSLLMKDSQEGVQSEEKQQHDTAEDSSDEKTVAKQISSKKIEMRSADTQEVAAAAVANVDIDASENATGNRQADVSGETQEKKATAEAATTTPTTTDDNSVQTQDNASSLKSESEDDEPDWKQLFLKGVENREQVLLAEYTTILRSYKEVKKKLTETETKGGDSLFDITIQLKELKAANAKKDEQIRMLKKKLSLLQQDNDDQPESPFTVADILHDFNLDLDDEISPIEERFRSSIDEVLEDNLDFWLRFSTTFQQVQQFETEVRDLQSELSELEEKLGKQEGSSHGKYSLKSDAKPLYKHLREIHAELTIWIEKGMTLKDELKGRFSALCEIQDDIKEALKESAEDEEFKFTSYQAAKFQGEILNMKQENNKVADELQAGLDHVTTLQLEVERTLAKLNEEFKLAGSKNRQNIQLQHSESRARVPLRSFIFGVKPKKQKHSIFACVHPVLHRKYNGFRSGLNL
ncbi:unnamed protein product [Linum tenue]|uniref:NAB domain-containing protein n=1 Tax=Linum tenue TaxID=586396 RepID=A0AAV0J1P2_9ROSI|nr:unnamed protein product [Linum tenue]